MSSELVLRRLGTAGAEAAMHAIAQLARESAEPGQSRLVAPGEAAARDFPGPAVVIGVVSQGEPDGGHVLLLPEAAARRVAETILGERSWASDADELGELERSALADLGTRVASGAAQAAAELLGRLPEPGAPDVALLADPSGVVSPDLPGHASVTHFTLGDDPCLLVQLFPRRLVEHAVERLERREAMAHRPAAGSDLVIDGEVGAALTEVPVRVWAELGRAEVALGRAARLDAGAIVELDDDVDDPVTLFAGGAAFAEGRLLRGEDGAWAVRIERLFEPDAPLV